MFALIFQNAALVSDGGAGLIFRTLRTSRMVVTGKKLMQFKLNALNDLPKFTHTVIACQPLYMYLLVKVQVDLIPVLQYCT